MYSLALTRTYFWIMVAFNKAGAGYPHYGKSLSKVRRVTYTKSLRDIGQKPYPLVK